ncbi:hypothetical protein LEP1GSC133_4400 [Leptospira borgpetersenii serovar Pomona str. 200901868]|uniref:Uncharacterized protein n=1 Tax=Leptospira borgpetersenii serovar Pomona str. 200901868 TaxID=1192866 RepID=M6W5R2_LEPBO|nr:hypothetical protein LEP1GSC133_4400 [Leptospira borgpetersenii serovar Pomona str. 200901868]
MVQKIQNTNLKSFQDIYSVVPKSAEAILGDRHFSFPLHQKNQAGN